MAKVVRAVRLLAATVFAGVSLFALYTLAAPHLAPPCEQPIEYVIGEVDARFGISEATLRTSLQNAAAVWNEAAGRVVVTASDDGKGMPVHLLYGDEQRAAQLGNTIDAEQAAYDAKKAELADMKETFASLRRSYVAQQNAYERELDAYEADIRYWNERGGAPPAEYQELQQRSRDLDRDRDALNADADEVSAYSARINTEVEELNALARKINAKVNVYNESAGDDFDQGNFVSDRDGKRIYIYEYTDRADLERVLAHEFGHALGIGHVENPNSIMYSFNIGEGLDLTEEDQLALTSACRLDK